MKIRTHAFVPYSHANGPGVRAVLWVQGCSIGCPGCFNPATHPPDGGRLESVRCLAGRIAAIGTGIEGITVTGGEPLDQLKPLLELLRLVREGSSLSVLLFTGYTWEEVQSLPEAGILLKNIDVLIAGRYAPSCPTGDSTFGRVGKTIHLLTGRYTMRAVLATPPGEVRIDSHGDVAYTGMVPPILGGR